MYNYCVAYKDGNILIRYGKQKPIQRYDKDKKKWVNDREMLAIFTDKCQVGLSVKTRLMIL